MRISDWSSDVCSSDLFDRDARVPETKFAIGVGEAIDDARAFVQVAALEQHRTRAERAQTGQRPFGIATVGDARTQQQLGLRDVRRSEEHTSELQSLMRTSYAVFCLKKKKQN